MDDVKKIRFGLVALFSILFILLLLFFFSNKKTDSLDASFSQKQLDYTIPGVPYFGIYNHTGEKNIISGDTGKAVASILEYWRPKANNHAEIQRYFFPKKGFFITGEKIKEFFDFIGKDEFIVHSIQLKEISEIKKYINPETKTPLFLFRAISVDQPAEVIYHPASVLIGIRDSEKKLVFHDYWFGNNYEISFDDFEKMKLRMRADERDEFIVIQPKDLGNKIKEINNRNAEPYSQRTEVMNKAGKMFENYAIGRGAFNSGMMDLAHEYLSNKVLNDSNFEAYFPPYYKVRLYETLGDISLKKGQTEEALKFALKAVELDHDLNKPFGDWPGVEWIAANRPDIVDKISDPYRVLGDVYMMLKDYSKAKENYEMAIHIQPTNIEANTRRESAERELLKSE